MAHKNGQVNEVSKADHSKAEPEERNSENNNEWGTKSLLKERKAELITQRQKLNERIAKLSGGVAVIQVTDSLKCGNILVWYSARYINLGQFLYIYRLAHKLRQSSRKRN